jgi:tRNA isopentenyl-2-thiomethyl-A-37 hydroxylase MiaE
MNELDTRLQAPFLPAGHPLHPIVASALKQRATPDGTIKEQAYWTARHFRLDQTTIYRKATQEEQQAILLGCSRQTLAELYFIEKSGMYFNARMSLLSESTEERMGYSLFAADEAIHFEWLRRYADADAVAAFAGNPFIQFIDDVLRTEDRPTLQFLVQILLEGWGLHHYQSLARDCRDTELTHLFHAILRDEARHHAGGLALFNAQGEKQRQRLVDHIRSLLSMVQAGPQMVAAEVDRAKGGLSREDRRRLFVELDCERETQRRLDILHSLIGDANGGTALLQALEERSTLQAWSADKCASI